MRTALISIFIILIASSCDSSKNEAVTSVETLISELKDTYAPDTRVAVFSFDVNKTSNDILINGETDNPKVLQALKTKLNALGIPAQLSVTLLPDSTLKGFTQGVIKNSVANLRSAPKHSAELSTQALLGTPVKVLKQEGEWYYIQTPDQYLSWIDHGGITLMDAIKFREWNSSEKIIYTATYGVSIATNQTEELVSDLVAGNLLELIDTTPDNYKVKYPDGRTAFIPKNEAELYSNWAQKQTHLTAENIINSSKTLLGVPYLWGGTSAKGVDCSGYTKTIYFLNGLILPRDASQQVNVGRLVDDTRDFSKLEVGDLLFFGTPETEAKKERVVHVGIWLGNNEFIHASEQVRISSVDKNRPNFDKFNTERYLRSKRILNVEDKHIIPLKSEAITARLNF